MEILVKSETGGGVWFTPDRRFCVMGVLERYSIHERDENGLYEWVTDVNSLREAEALIGPEKP